MAKKITIVGATPKKIEILDQPKRRVDPAGFAAALGANPCDQRVPRNADSIAIAELGTQLLHRLRSSGGRPALEDATINCRVPLSAEDIKTLEDMLSRISVSTGTKPSVGQLASVILRQQLNVLTKSPEGHEPHPGAAVVGQTQGVPITYPISQGWVEEQSIVTSISTPRGGIIPSTTSYYSITPAGIDKFEGTGEFTMNKFQGIKIEATGQNIITVGDGNQVNAKFADAAQALAELKEAFKLSSNLTEEQKCDVVGDIDSIQSQLAKPKPNKSVVSALWSGIEKSAKAAALADKCIKIGGYLSAMLGI